MNYSYTECLANIVEPSATSLTLGSSESVSQTGYDEAGWGTESASVSYTQIIPVLVKSNQELHERIVDHGAQIADLEATNDAKQRRIDELEERVNALAARMEALENV